MKCIHKLGINLDYSWRIKQLQLLKKMLLENENEFYDALYKDLGKHQMESYISEYTGILSEIDYNIKNLYTWMKPKNVSSPIVFMPCYTKTIQKPLASPGILIFGAFNYPLKLTLQIAIGCIAAGNPTVIKPSELCTNTSKLLKHKVDQYFGNTYDDDNCDTYDINSSKGVLQVVEGGIEESDELTSVSWGKIVFTGSARVGKIVAQKAAKTLTPTVLELGGKCPCVVDKTCPKDIVQVANRIIFGKLINVGQTCVAVDHILCHKSIYDQLQVALIQSIKKQYGVVGNNDHTELGKIVNCASTKRCIGMIQEVENGNQKDCEIIYGGSKYCRTEDNYVEPTIIKCELKPNNVVPEYKIFTEEIFAPLLPIIVYENRVDAINYINKNGTHNIPLALYVFTSSNTILNTYSTQCPSSCILRNDTVVHLGSQMVPLGGLGTSGYGNYVGKFSFDSFTHTYTVLYRPCFFGADLNMLRYHPYGNKNSMKYKIVHTLLSKFSFYVPVLYIRYTIPLLLLFIVFVTKYSCIDISILLLEYILQILHKMK